MDQSPRNVEMLLRPMDNQTVVDRIIDRLTATIVSGELKPGDKIPTELELSTSMGVARNSVREAIKALVAMGVLNIRRAEGTFVAEGFSERMLEPMVYGLILEGGDTPAVSELRYLFESGLVSLAIDKATPGHIEALEKALGAIESAIGNPQDTTSILEADMRFHREIERIVGNSLVEKIMLVIERISRPTQVQTVQKFIDRGELRDMLDMHRHILETIKDGDKASVGRVMDDHFKFWRETLHDKERRI